MVVQPCVLKTGFLGSWLIKPHMHLICFSVTGFLESSVNPDQMSSLVIVFTGIIILFLFKSYNDS